MTDCGRKFNDRQLCEKKNGWYPSRRESREARPRCDPRIRSSARSCHEGRIFKPVISRRAYLPNGRSSGGAQAISCFRCFSSRFLRPRFVSRVCSKCRECRVDYRVPLIRFVFVNSSGRTRTEQRNRAAALERSRVAIISLGVSPIDADIWWISVDICECVSV